MRSRYLSGHGGRPDEYLDIRGCPDTYLDVQIPIWTSMDFRISFTVRGHKQKVLFLMSMTSNYSNQNILNQFYGGLRIEGCPDTLSGHPFRCPDRCPDTCPDTVSGHVSGHLVSGPHEGMVSSSKP